MLATVQACNGTLSLTSKLENVSFVSINSIKERCGDSPVAHFKNRELLSCGSHDSLLVGWRVKNERSSLLE